MASVNETVREVCADAKNTSTNWIRTMNVLGVMPTRECIHRWCDRILAAHERELAAKDAEIERMIVANNAAIDTMQSRIDEMVEIVSATDAEIARLKAALKPVMECRIERIDGLDSPDGEFMTSSEYGVCDADGNEVDSHSIASALNAVREAQRIMKEGGEK